MRKYTDCREFPSVKGCTLKISGSEEEVVETAAMHAVAAHDEEDTPELREKIRAALKNEDEVARAA